MILRKIGMIVRGDSTPFQLMTACVLGAMLGFMPGLAEAAGSILLLTLLLILFNANLKLGAMVLLVSKLFALVLLPLSFKVGQWLLDGPLQPVFQSLINAPVLAFFGFEYYATTGGWALGIIFGLLAGTGVVRGITVFRKKMVSLEQGSPRFVQFTGKAWVKVLSYVLVGGGAKQSYEEILARKMGNPVRPLGLVFAGLLLALLLIVYAFAGRPIVTMAIQTGLERVNGATVDLRQAEIHLKEGRLTILDLAMADPNALDTDLLRAAKIEAAINSADLLRKRLQLDRVLISDAIHGEKRAIAGRATAKPREDRSGSSTRVPEWPDAKTLEDYFRNAGEWKDRLAQVRRWIENMSGADAAGNSTPDAGAETWRERLEREAREKGYARVRAEHLIEQSPTLTIGELIAEKMRVPHLPGETIDLRMENISTHPRLLQKTPRVIVRSSADTLGFEAALGAIDGAKSDHILNFHYRGLATDSIAQHLRVAGQTPVQGGTMDVRVQGTLQSGAGAFVDLPLSVTLHNATFSLPQMNAQKVGQFTMPIAVRGPLDNPRIRIDDKHLADSLVKAGVSKATARITEKAREEIGSRIGEEKKSLVEGLFQRPK
jgi:uncharacterized protein (TIGR03546 family)